MNNLTKTLLSGVAICGMAAVPVMAQPQHPAFSFTALHAGRVVNKTRHHRHHCIPLNSSCTFGVYSSVPASDLHKTVPLVGTYYKFNSNSTICSSPKEKINAPRKSVYAKIGTGTLTYSLGCASGPTVFYGDTYRLIDKSGEGKTDSFESTLTGKFKNDGVAYKGRLIFDVDVTIGTE